MKAFLLLLICPIICFGEIDNPIEDFIATVHSAASSDKIMVLVTNLRGAERQEVWLSSPTLTNGKAGNIWRLYQSADSGFTVYDQPIVFRAEAFTIRKSTKHGSELLTYHPGGAGSGSIIAFSWNGEILEERKVEEVSVEKPSKTYREIVQSDWPGRVRTVPKSEARKIRIPFSGKEE